MSSMVKSVDATPTKSFFVSMLTRDIDLEDAVLDLLDNCVDGIIRSGKRKGTKPYAGHKAEIKFNAESFSISDNCGGIPWDMHEYAFRMGRPPKVVPNVPGSVGIYGIGMKRAIFKIGKRCSISTRNANRRYEIEITPEWLENEKTWKIPVNTDIEETGDGYTKIKIGDLHGVISKKFDENEGKESFESSLMNTISTHYAYIINKGFKVTINGVTVEPRTVKIAFYTGPEQQDERTIRPFVFKGEMDGVSVYLAVGLTRKIPLRGEVEREQQAAYSSANAGWTIVCNDRIVLYNDRTEMTGWGEAGVPQYHTQFIAIAGIVEFRSEDTSKLPTTTTKRGIDASSTLYLRVKNKMREGMKIFTDYTNKWKSRPKGSAEYVEKCATLSLADLKSKAETLAFKKAQTLPVSKQHKPNLPVPPRRKGLRIAFTKSEAEIAAVAEYLGVKNMDPSDIGELCFDRTYEEAR